MNTKPSSSNTNLRALIGMMSLATVVLMQLACGLPRPVADFITGEDEERDIGVWPLGNPDEQPDSPQPQGGVEPGSSAEGPLKPVGFVNYGTFDAVVVPWTWIPLGAAGPEPPVSASTVSSANDGIGDWPNTSRFLSLPMGTYTWCIDWEEGDLDEDGQIDYFHYFDEEPVLLDENDSDDLDFAEEVSISAPPSTGPIYEGRCGAPPLETRCTGDIQTNAYVMWASTSANPPDYYAYPNPEFESPPEGVSITFGGSSTGYGSGRILWVRGDWVAAKTSNPISAIGVQVQGDRTIGWARVLYNGSEIWRGNTATTWNDGTNNGVYVEVSCLSPGTHTLRIEALGIDGGGGGVTVPVSWFAFRQ